MNDNYIVFVYYNSGEQLCHTWDFLKALAVYSKQVQEVHKKQGYTVRMFRNDEQIAIFQN